MVEAGADLLAKDALGLTPLDLADKMDHTECMEVLREAVDKKEQEKQKDFYNLLDACAAGDINTVKTILGKKKRKNNLRLRVIKNKRKFKDKKEGKLVNYPLFYQSCECTVLAL